MKREDKNVAHEFREWETLSTCSSPIADGKVPLCIESWIEGIQWRRKQIQEKTKEEEGDLGLTPACRKEKVLRRITATLFCPCPQQLVDGACPHKVGQCVLTSSWIQTEFSSRNMLHRWLPNKNLSRNPKEESTNTQNQASWTSATVFASPWRGLCCETVIDAGDWVGAWPSSKLTVCLG